MYFMCPLNIETNQETTTIPYCWDGYFGGQVEEVEEEVWVEMELEVEEAEVDDDAFMA